MEYCDWCKEKHKIANRWTTNDNGTKFESVEKFCSLKCKSEFENNYSITWQKKSYLIYWIILATIIVLVCFVSFKNSTYKPMKNEIKIDTLTNNTTNLNYDENIINEEDTTKQNIIEENTKTDTTNNINNYSTTSNKEDFQDVNSESQNIQTITSQNNNSIQNNPADKANLHKHQQDIEIATEMLKQDKSTAEIIKATSLLRPEIAQLRLKIKTEE